ncbi:MAG: hypothetical protein EU548_07355 [Promethearchaeota archaeon]|nr:MAG: hypothetical protein EU548_07355 [Candidatus Lokiarchaeota archaeon]
MSFSYYFYNKEDDINLNLRNPIKILIILFLSLGCIVFFNYNYKISSNDSSTSKEIKIETSESWTVSPFTIDQDGNGDYTWDQALSQPWCYQDNDDNYIIENLTIQGTDYQSCIEIQNSINVYFYIRNCTFYEASGPYQAQNDPAGITLKNTHLGKIYNNNIYNNWKGIYIDGGASNYIENNFIHNNYRGVVGDANYNWIILNQFYHNAQNDINLEGSNNYIEENTIDSNGYCAIYSEYNSDNYIADNIIQNNENGIILYLSNDNVIINNKIYNAKDDAIHIRSDNTWVSSNYIDGNKNGLKSLGGSYNTILNNTFINSSSKGIDLDTNSIGNELYKNIFKKNNINAKDDGSNNNWDNGSIGNYWDDYSGRDADDNGIGESPYLNIIGNSSNNDTFPIWWDPPLLEVNNPSTNETFGNNIPSFQISVLEGISYSHWYIINGSKFYFTGNSGDINQNKWNVMEDGIYSLKFFANDSRGKIGNTSLYIIKDTKDPYIEIKNPKEDELFGEKTITFDVLIDEANLDTIWYSINESSNYSVNATSGIINQDLWDNYIDCPVLIQFYINDTLGHQDSDEVLVRKDFPIWSPFEENQTIEYGVPYYNNFTAFDTQSVKYSVNNTNFKIDSSGILENNTILEIGLYSIQLNASDGNHHNIKNLKIRVFDTTGPNWDQIPLNQTIEFGNPFSYDLNASDLSGIDNYGINSTIFSITSDGIIQNNSPSFGVYWLEVWAEDPYKNNCSAHIKINVSDSISPSWNITPKNQVYEFGMPLNFQINATDLRNVTYNINFLQQNYTYDYFDDQYCFPFFENYITEINNSILVYYYDKNEEIQFLDEEFYEINYTTNTIELIPKIVNYYDFNPITALNDLTDFYICWHELWNDSFKIDNNGIIFNNSNLIPGKYGLEINASDGINHRLKLITIMVENSSNPEWIGNIENQYLNIGETLNYKINASDISGIDHFWVNDSRFSVNNEGVVTNITSLSEGTFWITVRVNDTLGNVNSISFQIKVENIKTSPNGNNPIIILILGVSIGIGVGGLIGGLLKIRKWKSERNGMNLLKHLNLIIIKSLVISYIYLCLSMCKS